MLRPKTAMKKSCFPLNSHHFPLYIIYYKPRASCAIGKHLQKLPPPAWQRDSHLILPYIDAVWCNRSYVSTTFDPRDMRENGTTNEWRQVQCNRNMYNPSIVWSQRWRARRFPADLEFVPASFSVCSTFTINHHDGLLLRRYLTISGYFVVSPVNPQWIPSDLELSCDQ